MNDELFRKNLIELLDMGSAHTTVHEAVADLSAEDACRRPVSGGGSPGGEASGGGEGMHSVYELLEHMRITQEDIVRYTMDPDWTSPAWPTEYWPSLPSREEREERWRSTRERFLADLEEVRGWVRDSRLDLTALIPHGEGRTYLRQVLLVADHNAYHLGQIVSARRQLGLWGNVHR